MDQDAISDITMTFNFFHPLSPAVYLLQSSCCSVCGRTFWSGANRAGGFKGGPAAVCQRRAGVIHKLIYTFCGDVVIV